MMMAGVNPLENGWGDNIHGKRAKCEGWKMAAIQTNRREGGDTLDRRATHTKRAHDSVQQPPPCGRHEFSDDIIGSVSFFAMKSTRSLAAWESFTFVSFITLISRSSPDFCEERSTALLSSRSSILLTHLYGSQSPSPAASEQLGMH